jgi:mono/diheme cytochrome c family protein
MKKLFFPILFAAALPLTASADDATAKQMEAGKATFMLCAACHGQDAMGVAAGPSKMAPAIAGSKIVLGNPAEMALVILKGIQKENATYLGVMAPLEAALDDQKLADVMTYVRGSFGNTAAPVTLEDAKKFREQWKDVKAPVTRAKIAELETEKK